ncbi:KilA-N domain-containing protein, partial [Acinetobacter baumannii]
MSDIIISGITIRRDANGRYCLNDLHKAAGEEGRHKPGNWLMLDQTKALVAEIEIAGIPAI